MAFYRSTLLLGHAVAAASAPPTVPTAPVGLHLSLDAGGTGQPLVLVTWATANDTATSCVEYGSGGGGGGGSIAQGSSSHFAVNGSAKACVAQHPPPAGLLRLPETGSDCLPAHGRARVLPASPPAPCAIAPPACGACSTHGFGYSAYVHRVRLPPLSPGQRFWYRAGDADGGWSATEAFTAPTPPAASSLRFLAVADLSADENDGGYGGVMRELAREINRTDDWQYDLLLHAGDLVGGRVAGERRHGGAGGTQPAGRPAVGALVQCKRHPASWLTAAAVAAPRGAVGALVRCGRHPAS